jgi:hypothetical protein
MEHAEGHMVLILREALLSLGHLVLQSYLIFLRCLVWRQEGGRLRTEWCHTFPDLISWMFISWPCIAKTCHKEIIWDLSGRKKQPAHKADNLMSSARCLEIVGASTSHNPISLHSLSLGTFTLWDNKCALETVIHMYRSNNVNMTGYLSTTLCNLLKAKWYFGGSYCLHLQDGRIT